MKTVYISKEIKSLELEISLLAMSHRTEDKKRIVLLRTQVEKMRKEYKKRLDK